MRIAPAALSSLAAASCLVASIAAEAQESDREARRITFQTLVLSGPTDPVYVARDGWHELNLSRRRISPAVATRVTDDRLVFHRRAEAQPETEGPAYAPIATVDLPEDKRNFLVLFSASDNEERPYRLAAVARDRAAGKQGQVVLFNLSSYRIAGQIVDQNFTIDRGGSRSLEWNENENQNITLRLARRDGEDWELAFSTVWGRQKRLNTLFFIVDKNRGRKSVTVRRFYNDPVPAQDDLEKASAGKSDDA